MTNALIAIVVPLAVLIVAHSLADLLIPPKGE